MANMKLGKKIDNRQSKPKKYWKPDEGRMSEYNKSIFETLWQKDEQIRKETEADTEGKTVDLEAPQKRNMKNRNCNAQGNRKRHE